MAKVKLERKNDWRLREACPEDEEGIKLLLSEDLWKNKDANTLYRWKYEENPLGRPLAPVGINSENKVISAGFFIPWKTRVKNRVIDSCQWSDMYVKLEYRGQDILPQTLTKFRASKFGLCFAFPNTAGVGVHKRNNGIHVGRILRYTRPLDSGYLVERYIKWPFMRRPATILMNMLLRLISKETYSGGTRGGEITGEERCGAEFDALWNACGSRFNGKVITVKDSKYLNWKYISGPNDRRRLYSLRKNGRLTGFVVLESTPEIGYVVDMAASGEDTIDALISYTVKHFRREKKMSVVFVALENNMYIRNFESFGFVKRPEEKHFYIYLNDTVKEKEFFSDSRNWFITIGDCDIERL